MRRLTESSYHALAAKRGFEWLGIVIQNANAKTTWRCSMGHEFSSTYGHLYDGKGCGFCAKNCRLTTSAFHDLAAKRGIKWVGIGLPTSQTITDWLCSNGHELKARYCNIAKGDQCRICLGRKIAIPADYHTLAESRNFICVAPARINHDKATWECPKGHRWEASYTQIKAAGSGCPCCLDMINGCAVSIPQRAICDLAGGELNVRVGRYVVDVALTPYRIAIEYDCWYWHGARQETDRAKVRFLMLHGWRVLSIKSKAFLPSNSEITEAVQRLLNGEKYVEIILPDWGKGVFKQKKIA